MVLIEAYYAGGNEGYGIDIADMYNNAIEPVKRGYPEEDNTDQNQGYNAGDNQKNEHD